MAQLTNTLIIGDLRVTGKVYGKVSIPRNPVSNYNDDYYMNSLAVSELGPSVTNCPSGNWYHTYTGCGSDTAYATQLALGMTTEKLMYRYKNNGNWQSWNSIVRSTANTQVGSTSKPVYIDSTGKAQECTSIPSAANDGTLTITQNGKSVGTFSANQSSNTTIAVTDCAENVVYGPTYKIRRDGTEDSSNPGWVRVVFVPATTVNYRSVVVRGKFMCANGNWGQNAYSEMEFQAVINVTNPGNTFLWTSPFYMGSGIGDHTTMGEADPNNYIRLGKLSDGSYELDAKFGQSYTAYSVVYSIFTNGTSYTAYDTVVAASSPSSTVSPSYNLGTGKVVGTGGDSANPVYVDNRGFVKQCYETLTANGTGTVKYQTIGYSENRSIAGKASVFLLVQGDIGTRPGVYLVKFSYRGSPVLEYTVLSDSSAEVSQTDKRFEIGYYISDNKAYVTVKKATWTGDEPLRVISRDGGFVVSMGSESTSAPSGYTAGTKVSPYTYMDYTTSDRNPLANDSTTRLTVAAATSYFNNYVDPYSVKCVYKQNNTEATIIFGKGATNNYGTVLQWGYNDNYLRLLKNNNNSWDSSWQKIYAGRSDSVLDKGSTGGNIIYSHWNGTAISTVSPSSAQSVSNTKWLIGAYADTDGAHYCAVDTANVTVQNALKINGRSIVVGQLGTDTNTLYFI